MLETPPILVYKAMLETMVMPTEGVPEMLLMLAKGNTRDPSNAN